MFITDFLGVCSDYFNDNGVFDQIMETDSKFFINIQRLRKAETPEFQGSYERINELFRKIIKLLNRASQKSEEDLCYKQALFLFNFPENKDINGLCLGYSEGKSGSGFGPILSGRVIANAYDIVKAGVDDPEFFQLLPLFQEDVGPDLLCDMIATIILPDIQNYTKRIFNELGVTTENYPDKEFNEGSLVNPYKQCNVLLVPVEILHKLPVAKSWEDIGRVASENSAIRAVMNHRVAEEWTIWTNSNRKSYLRNEIFIKPDICKRIVEEYCKEELERYNPEDQIDYFIERIISRIEKLGLSWKSSFSNTAIDSKCASMEILDYFKRWVEYNKGWEVVQDASNQKKEKIVQRVIHFSGLCYIQTNNLDMSCEPDEGRGPVDFKVSRGQDITIIEVKLSTNQDYLHGYETQIEEYSKAENTKNMVYVFIDLGNPGRRKKIEQLHTDNAKQGKKVPDVIIIDAREKESASVTGKS